MSVKDWAQDWWFRIHQHEDPADVYLARLDNLDNLEPSDALDIITSIQSLLDQGSIPGDESKVAELRSRLSSLYSKYSIDAEAVPIELPEQQEVDIESLESLVRKAGESLTYKARLWKEQWMSAVDERFGRQGSPFFATGGQPILAMNKLGVILKDSELLSLVMLNINELERAIDDVKNRGADASNLATDIQLGVSNLYTAYQREESAKDVKMQAFMDTYDLFLGMQNFTNIANQYVMRNLFLMIGNVIGVPLKWAFKLTKIGAKKSVTQQITHSADMIREMAKSRHPAAFQAYTDTAARAEANRLTTMAIKGIPAAPPSALTVNANELRAYLLTHGSFPKGFTANWTPAQLDEVRIAMMKVAGMERLIPGVALLGTVEATLKAQAGALADKAVPGGVEGFVTNTLTPYAEAGGRDFDAKISEWFGQNKAVLEETIGTAAAQEVDKRVEEQPPIPTIENAAQMVEVRRDAWTQRVIAYYQGIGTAREYAVLVELLAELNGERANAITQEELAWIDGLISAAESWVTIVANEQGLHPELGVQREADEFSTEMKVGAE